MKLTTALKFMKFWPPYFGAGIRVESYSQSIDQIIVSMKLRWFNKNYVGTHFGGSLYSMVDPFYMLMFIHLLGRDYIVWDIEANIKYKRPGKGKVTAKFLIDPNELKLIKDKADNNEKVIIEKEVDIKDENDQIVAQALKTIYIKKKSKT